ncbi:hypothetical protein Pint_07589 [Pistacia integerrima]|uniref:Uncharacterized protein n=1 Tax=Pistacia integerrima TaxID=434235 RepID=A0ACC0XUV6_9ROSI|nr:hypothetical protein Pint_07589 [Pistacia integerrima]
MVDDSKEEIVAEDQETSNLVEEPEVAAIIFHAFMGQRSPSTIRLHGNIRGQLTEWLATLGLVVMDYKALTMSFTWFGDALALQADAHCATLLADSHSSTIGPPGYSLHDRLLFYHGHVVVPTVGSLRQQNFSWSFMPHPWAIMVQHMVSQVDKCRQPMEFEVGQQVYLKLHPYRQLSMSGQAYSKLERQYSRPFAILKRVGKVAYKLALPEGSKIQPPHITPLAVLGHQIMSCKGVDVPQLLVQWHGLPLEDTSWEDAAAFKVIYRKLSQNLEDKVEVEQGTIDRNPARGEGREDGVVGSYPIRTQKAPARAKDYSMGR